MTGLLALVKWNDLVIRYKGKDYEYADLLTLTNKELEDVFSVIQHYTTTLPYSIVKRLETENTFMLDLSHVVTTEYFGEYSVVFVLRNSTVYTCTLYEGILYSLSGYNFNKLLSKVINEGRVEHDSILSRYMRLMRLVAQKKSIHEAMYDAAKQISAFTDSF